MDMECSVASLFVNFGMKMAKNDDTITVLFDKVDNNFHIKSRKHFTYFTKYLMTNESKITKNHIVLNSLQLLFRAKRSYSLIGRWWSVLLTGRSFLEREREMTRSWEYLWRKRLFVRAREPKILECQRWSGQFQKKFDLWWSRAIEYQVGLHWSTDNCWV